MKKGFTLAEVLITLALIGIVAMLVMPALFTNVSKHSYVAALKKNYNTITNAFAIYLAENGADTLKETSIYSEDGLKEFVNKSFKIHMNCEGYYNHEDKTCFPPSFRPIDNSKEISYANNSCMVTIELEDGAAYCIDIGESFEKQVDYDVNGDGVVDDKDKLTNGGPGAGLVAFEVDINGAKGPNVQGRDVFSFQVDNRGKIFDNNWVDEETFQAGYQSGNKGFLEKIMRDGWEMKY